MFESPKWTTKWNEGRAKERRKDRKSARRKDAPPISREPEDPRRGQRHDKSFDRGSMRQRVKPVSRCHAYDRSSQTRAPGRDGERSFDEMFSPAAANNELR